MTLLKLIFFGFLSVCAIVGCVRLGKLIIRGINALFDKIEDLIG